MKNNQIQKSNGRTCQSHYSLDNFCKEKSMFLLCSFIKRNKNKTILGNIPIISYKVNLGRLLE